MDQIDEESAVLSACLQSPGAWAEVYGDLFENDFQRHEHRIIWHAMEKLQADGTPIDEISVVSILRRFKKLTEAGGSPYITRLADTLPDIANVAHHAGEIRSARLNRRLATHGTYLIESSDTPEEKLSRSYSELADISKKTIRNKIRSVGESTTDFIADLFDENGVKEKPILTGFSEIDNALWINRRDLVLLAARPSIGKTAFSMQVATNVARSNRRVLFLSLEMATEQLVRRLLSMESGVSYTRILKSQYLSKANRESLEDAAKRIKTLPLEIDDSSGQKLGTIRMKARQVQASRGLDMIMIDHIGLMSKAEEYHEMTEISSGLKALAKDLDVAVWGISQLSRNIEYRDDRKPRLSDLRATGGLEQDADAVLMLWHPTKGNREKVEVLLEKNRNGSLGATTLDIDKNTTRFSRGVW